MKILRRLCARVIHVERKELRTCVLGSVDTVTAVRLQLQLHTIWFQFWFCHSVVPVSPCYSYFRALFVACAVLMASHFVFLLLLCSPFGLWLKLILAARSNVCRTTVISILSAYACVCVCVCMSICFHFCFPLSLDVLFSFFRRRRCRRFRSHSINITWNIQQSASNELCVTVLDKCINIYQANKYKVLSTVRFL